MFVEQYSGTYKDKVKWFAGTADGVVHITMSTMDGKSLWYDWMEGIQGIEMFEAKLSEMCEKFINVVVEPEPITDESRLLKGD